VVGSPSQTKVGFAATVTCKGATVILVTALTVPQPFAPVTVYPLVAVGVKVCPFVTLPVHV
jgi:hypothetical protein